MKPIKYTESVIKEEAQKAYDAVIAKLTKDAVACHGKGKGDKVKAEDRPMVFFSDVAWAKAQALVSACDKEIAWHGFVQHEAGTKTYLIQDVVVPPQTVTATSVDSDSNEWALWSATLTDDQFNSMRCHMHSHVNMGVFSSATDDDYQKDMVTKNGNLDYYIFLIFNKRGDIFARVYDVENNIMYDDDDVEVIAPQNTIISWATAEINSKVKIKTYSIKGTGRGAKGLSHKVVASAYDEDDDGYTYPGSFGYYQNY